MNAKDDELQHYRRLCSLSSWSNIIMCSITQEAYIKLRALFTDPPEEFTLSYLVAPNISRLIPNEQSTSLQDFVIPENSILRVSYTNSEGNS